MNVFLLKEYRFLQGRLEKENKTTLSITYTYPHSSEETQRIRKERTAAPDENIVIINEEHHQGRSFTIVRAEEIEFLGLSHLSMPAHRWAVGSLHELAVRRSRIQSSLPSG